MDVHTSKSYLPKIFKVLVTLFLITTVSTRHVSGTLFKETEMLTAKILLESAVDDDPLKCLVSEILWC